MPDDPGYGLANWILLDSLTLDGKKAPPSLKIIPSSMKVTRGTNVGVRTPPAPAEPYFYFDNYGTSTLSFTITDENYHLTSDVTVVAIIGFNFYTGGFDGLDAGDNVIVKKEPDTSLVMYGSNPYHVNSNVSRSAEHAGHFDFSAILPDPPSSGFYLVRVKTKAWGPPVTGSTANGVTSYDVTTSGTLYTIFQ